MIGAEKLVPDNAEMAFWHGVALATNGRLDAARPLFARAFAADVGRDSLGLGVREEGGQIAFEFPVVVLAGTKRG